MDRRPVTFCFNGGPGSSSVWLHLGALGPRRVKLSDKNAAQPAAFGLTDNEFSILPVTDLVFIDPVATGYSRPAGTSKAQQFLGEVAGHRVGGRVRPALDHAARRDGFRRNMFAARVTASSAPPDWHITCVPPTE